MNAAFRLTFAMAAMCISALPAQAQGQPFDRTGFQAQFQTFSHNVRGTVTIVDEDTLSFENFSYDGGGFSVFFYLGANASEAAFAQGLPFGPQLVGTTHNGSSFTLDLPSGVTMDAFNGISVWCVPAGFSFGSGAFQQQDAQTYCTPKVNSLGCTPSIQSVGLPSMTNPSVFTVSGSGIPADRTGALAYSLAADNTPFAGGTRCIAGPMRIGALTRSGGTAGTCDGILSVDFNARIQAGLDPTLVAGREVFVQYIYRDPQDPTGIGLTDAASFFVGP